MCKQAFQLEPTFDWEELPGQSRFKFKANVKFHGTCISCCRGQNKAEAKKAGAKLALHRVAPKLYMDLFQDEKPPQEFQEETDTVMEE